MSGTMIVRRTGRMRQFVAGICLGALLCAAAPALAQTEDTRGGEAVKPAPPTEPGPRRRPNPPPEQPGRPAQPPQPVPPAQAMPSQPQRPVRIARPVRLQVEILRVDMPVERVAELDVAALSSKAVRLADLLKALGEYGPVTVQHRVEQGADLNRETRVEMTSDVPYTASSSTAADGRKLRSFGRERIGAKIDVHSGGETENGEIVEVRVELSLISQPPSTDEDLQPVIQRITQMHSGPVELGKPIVIMGVDGGAVSGGKVPAIFTRLVCAEP